MRVMSSQFFASPPSHGCQVVIIWLEHARIDMHRTDMALSRHVEQHLVVGVWHTTLWLTMNDYMKHLLASKGGKLAGSQLCFRWRQFKTPVKQSERPPAQAFHVCAVWHRSQRYLKQTSFEQLCWALDMFVG